MTPNETTIYIIAGIGVAALVWYASQQTDSVAVPEVQGEGQVMGLGVSADLAFGEGTPLDMTQHFHGYHPGYDPAPSAQPVTQSRHRYPVLPGGNISNVMHHGWSQVAKNSPAGNDWRLNPPEVAVI